jgi:hypothetical protein
MVFEVKEPLKRWVWFVTLWAGGVVTVTAGAYLIKMLLSG